MKLVILDTNAYRRLYESDSRLSEVVESCERVLMSPVVLGELLAGYKKGNKEKENLGWLKRFMDSTAVKVAVVGEETARSYAQVKVELGRRGRPVPTNDMWIAAQAMESGAVLITYDEHFDDIAGLRLWEK